MSDEKSKYAEVLNFQSCLHRLGTLIAVLDSGSGISINAATRQNVYDDLIEVRKYLVKIHLADNDTGR
jgi:hypothetical protein